jgi:hypothetical protein
MMNELLIYTMQADLCPLVVISKEEIYNTLSALCNNKSPGPDGLVNEQIKFSLCGFWLNFYNDCYNHGIMPKGMNYGTIHPVIKKADKEASSLENIRPITVSNAISNALETLILRRVNEQLPEHRLEFGFRAATSINHAVALLNTIIYFT